mgnify:FL=1
MNMTVIRMSMEKIIDPPASFLLLTFAMYLLVDVLIAAICYAIACMWSQKTEMTGTVRVGLFLNNWFEEGILQDAPEMGYGSFCIPMGPAGVDGKMRTGLTWKEKAMFRRYRVSAILERYLIALKAAGLGADPSAKLLEELLQRDAFCDALGSFCFRSSKKGLTVIDAPDVRRGTDRKKVCVYCKLDGGSFETAKISFTNATECSVQTICVSLEYQV